MLPNIIRFIGMLLSVAFGSLFMPLPAVMFAICVMLVMEYLRRLFMDTPAVPSKFKEIKYVVVTE